MTNSDPLLILTYHAIDDRPDVISVSPEQFGWQMEQLAARGLNGISLGMAFEHLEKTGQYPSDSVVLTFDDGYLSVLEHALPVLQPHGFSATVFLVAGMMGMRRWRRPGPFIRISTGTCSIGTRPDPGAVGVRSRLTHAHSP